MKLKTNTVPECHSGGINRHIVHENKHGFLPIPQTLFYLAFKCLAWRVVSFWHFFERHEICWSLTFYVRSHDGWMFLCARPKPVLSPCYVILPRSGEVKSTKAYLRFCHGRYFCWKSACEVQTSSQFFTDRSKLQNCFLIEMCNQFHVISDKWFSTGMCVCVKIL